MLAIRGRNFKSNHPAHKTATYYVINLVNFFHLGDGGKTSGENEDSL
jgi:hypothetical protein